MRASVLLLLMFSTPAWADTSIGRSHVRAGEIVLPGWKKPIRLGMSLEEVRQAAPAPLDVEGPGPMCPAKHQCLVHRGEYTSDTDPMNYWLSLQLTAKHGLDVIELSCNSTEGCGNEHPLYRFWKEKTGSRTASRTIDGVSWSHSGAVSDESGDLSEDFTIFVAAKRPPSRSP